MINGILTGTTISVSNSPLYNDIEGLYTLSCSPEIDPLHQIMFSAISRTLTLWGSFSFSQGYIYIVLSTDRHTILLAYHLSSESFQQIFV